MNLFEADTEFSLDELLLEADISASTGEVVVRSSGRIEEIHNFLCYNNIFKDLEIQEMLLVLLLMLT